MLRHPAYIADALCLAAKSEGVSGGLLAGVGALVLAAGTALSRQGGSKATAPKPNKIKAKIQVKLCMSSMLC